MGLTEIMDKIHELMELEYDSNDIDMGILTKWLKFTARVNMWGYTLLCPCNWEITAELTPLHLNCMRRCIDHCKYSDLFVQIKKKFVNLQHSEQYDMIVYFSDHIYKLIQIIEKRDS